MKKQVGDRVTARDREGNIIWQPTIRGIARLHSPTPDGYEPVVMLVEHDMKTVMGVCQKLSVIDFGKKIAEGSPEEILRNQQVIEAYLGAGETAT